MKDLQKKECSETDICDLFITPAIKEAGWDPICRIRREVTLTPGPVIVRGNLGLWGTSLNNQINMIKIYCEPLIFFGLQCGCFSFAVVSRQTKITNISADSVTPW